MNLSLGRTHLNKSPSKGLAGIQVLQLLVLFLGPSSGHYMARLAKRWQQLDNVEAASPFCWQESIWKETSAAKQYWGIAVFHDYNRFLCLWKDCEKACHAWGGRECIGSDFLITFQGFGLKLMVISFQSRVLNSIHGISNLQAVNYYFLSVYLILPDKSNDWILTQCTVMALFPQQGENQCLWLILSG